MTRSNFAAFRVLFILVMSCLIIVGSAYASDNCLNEAASSPVQRKMAAIVNAIESQPSSERNSTLNHADSFSCHNQIEAPLIRGKAIFGEIADMVRNAKREVLIQIFQWYKDSEAHRLVKQALLDRVADENSPLIDIYILVSYDPAGKPVDMLKEEFASIPDHKVRFHYQTFPTIGIDALHSKVVVMDGKKSITTGAGFKDFFIEHNWYEIATPIVGESAAGLRKEFFDAWFVAHKGIKGEEYVNRLTSEEKRALINEFNADIIWDFEEDLTNLPSHPVYIATRRASTLLFNFNERINNPQNIAYLTAMKEAERVVRIQSPNLNDDHAVEAIRETVRRGVKVEIILSKCFNFILENFLQGGANSRVVRNIYLDLTREERDLLDVRWFSGEDGKAIVDDGDDANGRMNCAHAKYFSMDGEILYVGSANMDTQSWNRSREVNTIIGSSKVTKQYDNEIFIKNFKNAEPVCKDLDDLSNDSCGKELDCPICQKSAVCRAFFSGVQIIFKK